MDFPFRSKARVGDYSRVPDADYTLRPHPQWMSISPPFLGGAVHTLVAAASGFVCPNYSTVTVSFATAAYSPPNAGDYSVVLKFPPCAYTPPTVI
jgi:hypothetical protein